MKNDAYKFDDLMTNIQVYHSEFESLIKSRLGISMRHQKSELDKAVLQACIQFQISPEEYLEKLQTCLNNSPYIEHIIASITIGETYFFRDANQMKLLNEEILPEIIRKKRSENDLSIRIWSAGCSSGEEIYSIAMLLVESISDLPLWNIHLLGTDINTAVLQKAINGRYSEWSMRSITPYFRDKYFIHENNKYVLARAIADMVNFYYLNLNENSYPSIFNGTNAQDLIICRNVLIYFESETTKRVMEKFYKSLMFNGYLLLGASDPIDNSSPDASFQNTKGMLFCRTNVSKAAEIKNIKLVMSEDKIPRLKPELIKKYEPVPSDVSTITAKKEVKWNQAAVTELVKTCEWEKILKIPDQGVLADSDLVFLLNTKAMAFANLGLLEKALAYCEKSLAIDQTNKFTHFTLALILSELNRSEEAEIALRKTLFLDHQFVAGHFQLGLLLLKNKKEEAGLKSLRNAFSIATKMNANDIVPGSSGVSYGNLSKTLQHELDLYMESGTNDL